MNTIETKHWDRQTKDSWMEQVKKDNPFILESDYTRTIEEGIVAKSFVFPSDIKKEGHILKITGNENFCKIGIRLQNENIGELKSALQIALDNGAEYIHFVLSSNTSIETFNQLIENVYLDMLVTKWTFPSNEFMFSCTQLMNQRFDKLNTFYILPNPTISDITTAHYYFSPFQSKSWSQTIRNLLNDFKNNSQSSPKILCELHLTNDILLNISSIRALKLVMNKIWMIFDLKTEVYFEANIDENSLTADVHSNIYKLAAMALSSTLSGVDFLILPPDEYKSGASDNQWLKTSLHTQHILKQEAHLSNLIDPTAGSYFIEDLTEQIAEKLWLDLQEHLRND